MQASALLRITRCCIFDNPATMAREAYKDGVFLGHITANLLESAGFNGHPSLPFYFNVGRWDTGRIVGDPHALTAGEKS